MSFVTILVFPSRIQCAELLPACECGEKAAITAIHIILASLNPAWKCVAGHYPAPRPTDACLPLFARGTRSREMHHVRAMLGWLVCNFQTDQKVQHRGTATYMQVDCV